MLETQIEVRVRYAETDQMRVVYHANYLPWFEQARVHMLDELGFPYARMEAEGSMLPVIHCELDYHRPAMFDDRLTVTATVEKIPKLKLEICYRVERDDVLLTTGSTTHVFMSPDGKMMRPPKHILEIFKQALGQE
ncbi:MAG: acyl-CoA thioesterase [Opitutales bacterium]|nr:acyl-CoA thioesterase [Opitutales bacterium]